MILEGRKAKGENKSIVETIASIFLRGPNFSLFMYTRCCCCWRPSVKGSIVKKVSSALDSSPVIPWSFILLGFLSRHRSIRRKMNSLKITMDKDLMCEPTNMASSARPRRISRVPCKARGISSNHTAWNSYIDIPIDATHGDELCCSNNLCANSGRKFRYCASCALPVASRNFSKRHSHGLVGPLRQTAMVLKKRSTEDSSAHSAQRLRRSIAEIPRVVGIPESKTESCTRSLELTVQEQQFLDLMQARPSDGSPYLASWIQSVLDLTSFQAGTTEALDEVESYERAQLQDAALEDEEDGSLESGKFFEIGKFSHGERWFLGYFEKYSIRCINFSSSSIGKKKIQHITTPRHSTLHIK